VSNEVASATNRGTSRRVPRRPVPMRHLPPEARTHLRGILVAVDAVALALAWSITLLPWPSSGRPLVQSVALVVAFTLIGLWLVHAQGLYLARNSTIRTMEMARLGKAVVLLGLMAWAGTHLAGIPLGQGRVNGQVAVGTLATLGLLLTLRSTYRAWVTTCRRNGRFVRNVLVIGANREAAELLELMSDHADLGFRVVGVLGDRDDALANGLGHLWCGSAADAPTVIADRGATGVVIAVGAVGPGELTELVRVLHDHGVHVHISSGMRRIGHRRLRALPLAYEPLFYVEPAALPTRQVAVKRAIDLVVSCLVLVLTAPLLTLIAILVKLGDRGPIFFAQTRVGTDGRHFKLYKFRTMVVDAEARLAALTDGNERHGPLFKMDHDPRVTRIGRFLRDSSLDELPQLFNVVRGEMSLVGPRPALPREVAQFDDELLDRTKVKPGITGLWQVEARDNPSFAAYRRLDLYYVDNWSAALDLVILIGTVEQVVTRLVTTLARRRRHDNDVEADALAESLAD
jgi:exopolysaccharide biosynthesis polyprenyl glycosylphosphotransferase